MSVKQMLSDTMWIYFGHSGYEYIDLGRAFQIALLAGLLLWLALMARGILPALRKRDEQRPILMLFLIASVGSYGAALGAGRHTNLAIAEYWRWWVVHLWVEGFFEVFATVVIAFLFARLKLVRLRTAGAATRRGRTASYRAPHRGYTITAGRSISSSPSRSGIWWARGCSGS